MTVWFTSDLHIGHMKIAAYRWEAAFPDAPMSDAVTTAEWHDEALANNWDAAVRPNDDVWVLGDISAGGSAAQRGALDWVSKRPGRKHLIAGNHDKVHPMHRDSHNWLKKYYEVFDSVQSAARRYIPLVGSSSQAVLLSHFPYEGEGDRPLKDRYTQWRLRDEGMALLHGHVHSKEKITKSSYQHPTTWEGHPAFYAPAIQIHVGVDAWELKPVAMEQISELLNGR